MVHPMLVVDDDPVQLELTTQFLKDQFGYDVIGVLGGRAAIEYFMLKRTPQPEMVIINYSMMDMNGIEVVRTIRRSQKRVPVVMLTSTHHGNLMADALNAGVDDVLIKPVNGELLKQTIWNVLQREMLGREVERLTRYHHSRVSFMDVESHSEAMQPVLLRAKQAADSRVPALLGGAQGVGREHLARAIHGSSSRSGAPFVAVNCALLSNRLLSEKHIQKEIESARGGTLLLKHVDALTPPSQMVLLRAFDAQKSWQLSAAGTADQPRIISTASASLKRLFDAGAFCDELYFFLAAFPIQVPPLAQRLADLPSLCDRFLSRYSLEYRDKIVRLSSEAMQMLNEYAWPGNVRELQSVLIKALLFSVHEVISAGDIANVLAQHARSMDALVEIPSEWDALIAQHAQMMQPFSLVRNDGNIRTIHELEADVIRHAIQFYNGKMTEVAKRLGIGRSTLYRKIQDYNIEGAT